MRGSSSGSMPMPWSCTVSTISPPSRRACSAMVLPSGLYFEALCNRFEITCVSRATSPRTHKGSSGTCTLRVCRCRSTLARTVSTLCATRLRSSKLSYLRTIFPSLMRETSSSSSMSRVICRDWRLATSIAQVSLPSPGAMRRITSIAVTIDASGLRSSCDIIARNSSLRRLASCSACWAACRSTICRCSRP